MPTKLSAKDAAAHIAKLILEANIPSLRTDVRRDLVEKAQLNAECGMSTYVTYQDPYIFGYEMGLSFDTARNKVDVTWGSMNRAPANARAMLALATKVTDLACLIEAFFENVEIEPV